jgi:hypothetical protein
MLAGNCPGYLHCEVNTVQIPIWVLWLVAKSLRSLNQNIKEIADALQSKN